MANEITMRINGSSTSIKPSDNHAGVGGLTGDTYDMMAIAIERNQAAFVGTPKAPNYYYGEIQPVDYMGYDNPTYHIRGVIDELSAEQVLVNDATSGQSVTVYDGTKFQQGDLIYIWDDDSDGESMTVQSVSSTTVTFTSSITGSYTTANHARIRCRNRVGRRVLQYFLEEATEKVLVDPVLCPYGITVQVESITMSRESSSISMTSSSSANVPNIGAIMNYDITLVETPTGVT